MNIYYLKRFRKKYGYYYTKKEKIFVLLNLKNKSISEIVNRDILLKQYSNLEFTDISFEAYFNNTVYELVFNKFKKNHKYQRALRSFRNRNKRIK